MRVGGLKIQQHQRDAALNSHEKVVEIVSNAGRKGPQGLHSQHLLKPPFYLLLLGDIPQKVEGSPLSFPGNQDGTEFNPHLPVSRADQTETVSVRELLPSHPSSVSLDDPLPVKGMDVLGKRRLLQVHTQEPPNFSGFPVGELHATFLKDENGLVGVFHKKAILLLAFDERSFHTPALRDIASGYEDTGQQLVSDHGGRTDLCNDSLAILPDELGFIKK